MSSRVVSTLDFMQKRRHWGMLDCLPYIARHSAQSPLCPFLQVPATARLVAEGGNGPPGGTDTVGGTGRAAARVLGLI